MTITLVHKWRCLDCDAHGDKDRDAEKHTKTTKHATTSWGTPA